MPLKNHLKTVPAREPARNLGPAHRPTRSPESAALSKTPARDPRHSGVRRLFLALALILPLHPAGAHLAFPEFHSIKTTLTADAEGIHALVVVEIPLADLILAFNQHFAHLDLIDEIEKGNIEALEDEFRKATFERLAAGLDATLDGSKMPAWKPAPDPINGRAGEGFFVYILETRSRPAGREASFEFHNKLFPEQRLVLANLALAEAGWQVLETSTPQPPPGTDLTEGSETELELWSDDPEKRTFSVKLGTMSIPDRD